MLSPSEIAVRPASQADRLTPEVQAEAPAQPEPTPTIMAERFAPGGQKVPAEAPVRLPVEPPVMPGLVPQQARAASSNRWLLVASIVVSLVPTAVILSLLSQGMIALPGQSTAPIVIDYAQIADSQRASMAAVPMIPALPAAVEMPVKPEIALTTPSRVGAKPGDEIAFDIAIDSDGTLPARSVIAIRALPEGTILSQGRPYAEGEWTLRPDEIGDLRLQLPPTAIGKSDLRIELVAADGSVLAGATSRLDIVADPKATLILRAEESDRVANLIEHGHKMIDVGYFAGARAYFRRAAEAGSGEAALQLGATYDPEFIDRIGAHGIKADLDEARAWYERAKQLGVESAEEKLRALKDDWTNRDKPSQAAEATPAATLAGVKPGAEADPAESTERTPASPASGAGARIPAGQEEWVALVNYANVRAEPSSNADTLRVAEKGAKLLVTGRKGNWVQVTDPATAEVGWIYSRFIETAQSPVR
jgi:hypothetical protein